MTVKPQLKIGEIGLTQKTFTPGPDLVACYIYQAEVEGIVLPQAVQGSLGSAPETDRCLILSVGSKVPFFKPGDEVLIGTGAAVSLCVHKGNRSILTGYGYVLGVVDEDKRTEPREVACRRHGIDFVEEEQPDRCETPGA
jgi:hypothetical protein